MSGSTIGSVRAVRIGFDFMKKSAKVSLTVVAVIGLASCGRRRMDPCEASYFSQQACKEAIDRGGVGRDG